MLVWLIAIAAAVVILGLLLWAAGGRGAGDAERSSSWGRGPSDGGSGGAGGL